MKFAKIPTASPPIFGPQIALRVPRGGVFCPCLKGYASSQALGDLALLLFSPLIQRRILGDDDVM